MILAIDPGTTKSAYVFYGEGRVHDFGIRDNDDDMIWVCNGESDWPIASHVAIEMVACYGMAVGREVFETCVWIGRFIQAFNGPHTKVYRTAVKSHLCHSARAKDANVRQALIDKFGPGKEAAIGTKKKPGPLYGVTSHVWAALAVAVTYNETMVKP